MNSLVTTPPLGSKDNPRYLPKNKKYVDKDWYLTPKGLRRWRSGRLRKEVWRPSKESRIRNYKKLGKKKREKKTKDERLLRRREIRKKRYETDPGYKALMIHRIVIWRIMTLRSNPNDNYINDIGCSSSFLRKYIKSLFKPGMNFSNYGRGPGKWNIDHRKPCDSFDLNNEEQKYMCFHWTNLQPMWSPENKAKANDYNPETFRYKWIDREIGWVGIPKYLMNK
jgi:hypothetical protein